MRGHLSSFPHPDFPAAFTMPFTVALLAIGHLYRHSKSAKEGEG